jgi:hypothetical protein
MPDPDYKALCAELADALAEQDRCWMLINEARTALAHPEPVAPASSSIIAAAALKVAANDWRIDTEFICGVEYIRTSTLDAIANELEGK